MKDRKINPSLDSGETLARQDAELTRSHTRSTAGERPGRTPSCDIISTRDGEMYFVPSLVPLKYDEALLSIKTSIGRQKRVLEKHHVPDHFKAPGPQNKIANVIFSTLCLISFGRADLEVTWAAIKLDAEGDEDAWLKCNRELVEKLTNINLVAGLLVSACAAFLTTIPPNLGMLNYTLRGPYLCLIISLSLLVGGIIVGSSSLLVAAKTTPYWAEEVLYGNRFHIYCTLILVAFPVISIGAATLLLAFGLLSAGWCAKDPIVKAVCAIVLVLPVSMGILFTLSVATMPAKTEMSGVSAVERGDQRPLVASKPTRLDV